MEEKYVSQLTTKEQIALQIAKKYLESSFDLKKSIGYQDWKKKK